MLDYIHEMQSLIEKVQNLKVTAYVAGKTAQFWEQKIAEHGERKAEDFYLSLGHNHIERKGVDWEGLKLSREPKEHEKFVVKGIAKAQESAKEAITKVLLDLRSQLIDDGLKGIKKLAPAEFHTLILQVPPESRRSLRDRLVRVYRQGRRLVAAELRKEGKQDEKDEFDELDMLTDLTDARVVNDVQSRIIAEAGRYALLGLTGAALFDAVRGQIADGSVSYIDRTSTGVANKVINIGRDDEARDRGGFSRIEYSSILDQNVCGPCLSEDGTESEDGSDLQPVPNPECEGGDWCRCFWVYIQD